MYVCVCVYIYIYLWYNGIWAKTHCLSCPDWNHWKLPVASGRIGHSVFGVGKQMLLGLEILISLERSIELTAPNVKALVQLIPKWDWYNYIHFQNHPTTNTQATGWIPKNREVVVHVAIAPYVQCVVLEWGLGLWVIHVKLSETVTHQRCCSGFGFLGWSGSGFWIGGPGSVLDFAFSEFLLPRHVLKSISRLSTSSRQGCWWVLISLVGLRKRLERKPWQQPWR